MPTTRFFGWNNLGFLPHGAWGGGPDGDGVDMFGDRVGGINADGDCFDPMVRRDRIEHTLERGEGATAIACLLATRGKPPRKKPKPTIVCPGSNGAVHISAAPPKSGFEVVPTGSGVFRRRRIA